MGEPRPSHPRPRAGHLTVAQLAERLAMPRHWISDRIHTRTITIARDPASGLYLFPDAPATLEQFRQLAAGILQQLPY